MMSVNGFRMSHAVVIGINAYGDRIPQLRTAVNDASRIGQVLEAEFGYAVAVLTEDVTLGKLKALLAENLPLKVQADDRLLVYFAGHGIALDGDDGPAGYLVPQDARPDDRQTFLPMTDVSGWLNRLPCRHLLLVLDCCFAGAFRWSSTRELGGVPEVLHKERFDRYIRDPAWQVITSAAYDQKALDVLSGAAIGQRAPDAGAGDHSPFAAGFLRALQGEADLYPRGAPGRSGGDGVITATELYLYLRGCVEDEAEGGGHRQTPGLWPLKKHDKGEYIHLVPGHELNLPPAPELNEANNPYRGLQSYDEEQAPVFFGRSQFIDRLAERVGGQTLTIVLGASGTGKSSVVKAGLLPHLRTKEASCWHILSPIRPGKSPLASLATLNLSGEDGSLGDRIAEFWTDPAALAARVGAWTMREPVGRLLLVVDQFEELITLGWDAGEREQFLRLLGEAITAHPDRLRVVFTLRSDFEPQFAHSGLGVDWMSCRIVVPAMTLDEYREVIEGPASVRVVYFQGKASSQEFINRLIGDVANTPGALPLLSFTLSELYRSYLERSGDDRALWESDYEQLGGVGGSLRNRANEVYDRLPDDDHRGTMRKVMLRMISVEGGEIARRHVPDSELFYDDPDENRRREEVIRRLTEARLIVEGKEFDDQSYIEPAHDELVRGWDRLRDWTRESLDNLQLRQVLSPSVRDWCADREGDPGKLWNTNPRLALLATELGLPVNWGTYLKSRIRALLAQGVAESKPRATWLNLDESRFVTQSLARRHRTTSRVAATTLAVVVALLGLTVAAYYERGVARRQRGVAEAESARAQKGEDAARTSEGVAKEQTRIAVEKERIATSRQLAALSSSERTKHLDRSLLLAVEALQAEKTFEARDSLFGALQDQPELASFLRTSQRNISKVIFSRDGRTLAALCGDCGGVVLWDVTTRQPLTDGLLRVVEGPVFDVAFSPDGKTFAAAYDGGVVLLDVASRRRLTDEPLRMEMGSVSGMDFSPDGKTLAAGYNHHVADFADADAGVILWDVASRRRLEGGPHLARGYFVRGVAFSPDGRTLAGACGIANRGGGPLGFVLWDVATHRPLTDDVVLLKEGNNFGFFNFAFSPDGRTLAIGYGGGRTLASRYGVPAVGGVGGGVVLWDVATHQRLDWEPLIEEEGYLFSIAFSPDGRTLAAGYSGVGDDLGGGVVLWDVIARRRAARGPLLLKEGHIAGIAFSPDGRTLAAGYRSPDNLRGSGGVALWSMDDRQRLAGEPLPVPEGSAGGGVFSPDGRTLAAFYNLGLGGRGGGVVLWDASTRRRLALEPISESVGSISGVAFSPGGQILAAGYQPGAVGKGGGMVFWDLATRRRLGESLPVTEGLTGQVLFSPDGKTLAAGFGGAGIGLGGGAVLWDASTRRRLAGHPPSQTTGTISGIAFSPDGRTLAVGTGGSASVVMPWDVAACRLLDGGPLPVPEGFVVGVVFSPDGRTLVSGCIGVGASSVILWDAATGRRLEVLPLPVAEGATSNVLFSPDGRTLAASYNIGVGGGVGGVVLWDAATRRQLAGSPLPVAEGTLTRIAFSPDGRTLAASCNAVGSGVGVVLWDVATRQRKVGGPLPMNEGAIWNVAFSPDGTKLAALNIGDGTGVGSGLVLWDVALESWRQIAGRIANRNFTWDEWRQYIPDEAYRRTFRELPWPSDIPATERKQAEQREVRHDSPLSSRPIPLQLPTSTRRTHPCLAPSMAC
jgi:WD40 repeat protein